MQTWNGHGKIVGVNNATMKNRSLPGFLIIELGGLVRVAKVVAASQILRRSLLINLITNCASIAQRPREEERSCIVKR